jgi:aspartyl-tRNA(Asn)/glutamyl-tRNA(Gln) amidotransferase subunit C
MSLTAKNVARIAQLARIDVEDAELESLAGELNHILSWVETLNAIPTDGVEPMVGVGMAKAPLREDVVTDGAQSEAVLSNAPDTVPPFFTVLKVIE